VLSQSNIPPKKQKRPKPTTAMLFLFLYLLIYKRYASKKKYIIGIYREISKTFMQDPYFYHGLKMVKTAIENRNLNLPRNQDSKPNNYVSPNPYVQI